MHADADAGGFLAGIKMHEARDVAGGEFDVHRLLEFADEAHAPIGGQEFVARELQPARHEKSSPKTVVVNSWAAMIAARAGLASEGEGSHRRRRLWRFNASSRRRRGPLRRGAEGRVALL